MLVAIVAAGRIGYPSAGLSRHSAELGPHLSSAISILAAKIELHMSKGAQ